MIVHRGKNVTYFNMVLNPLSMPSGPVIPSNHIMHVSDQATPHIHAPFTVQETIYLALICFKSRPQLQYLCLVVILNV